MTATVLRRLNRWVLPQGAVWAACWIATTGQAHAAPPTSSPQCDSEIRAAFRDDPQTKVVLTRTFKEGDTLALSDMPSAYTTKALRDLCLVKLMVGPGNPGPANAPSTSGGIGIEIWLPMNGWNGRIHAVGGGGWQGGPAGSAAGISFPAEASMIAGSEGAASSVTDAGHARFAIPGQKGGGDFAMTPEGTVNTVLWKDLATRSLHEQAVKTKAVVKAFYGKTAHHAYFEGGSQGGRQAFSLAQNYPDDYDGITFRYPAINFTQFITGGLYPQIVYQRDLDGVPLSNAQLQSVSMAAIRACDTVGGQHLGYIMDPESCRYDPARDPDVLCAADGGRAGAATCVNRRQATVVNKIWYGMTLDGSVPDPAKDNGWNSDLAGKRRWFGPLRGTSLDGASFQKAFGLAMGLAIPAGPFSISTDMVALELQNPTIAGANFENATGNGEDGWKALSYAQLSNALDRGVALQPAFGNINTDNPDLSAFKAHGGKIIGWHGLADELIPVQGTLAYVRALERTMGGWPGLDGFFRLYLVPSTGHSYFNGSANPESPAPLLAADEMYNRLTQWVERGMAPGRIDIETPAAAVRMSQPLCPYPLKPVFKSGDPRNAASYACDRKR